MNLITHLFFNLDLKIKRKIFLGVGSRGDFSMEVDGTLPQNSSKPSQDGGPMKSYPVMENHIGSAVCEILCYKQTDRKRTYILLLYYLRINKIS